MAIFRVIVGGVGSVYEGNNYMQASCKFDRYLKTHKSAGIILLHNGKIKREHVGNGGESTERIEA